MSPGVRPPVPGRRPMPDPDPPDAPVPGPGGRVADSGGAEDGVAGGGNPGRAAPDRVDDETRVARRHFFRAFATDALHLAANVAGAAEALRDASAEAAGTLVGGAGAVLGGGPAERVGGEAAPGTGPWARRTPGLASAPGSGPDPGPGDVASPPVGFRSPFRLDGDTLVLLDQRRLPGEIVEVRCHTGAEVAVAIRDLVIRGAPALGQVAALGLALSVGRAAGAKPYARRAVVRGTANALRNSRPTAVNVAWSMDRMLAVFGALDAGEAGGEAIALALREEAEAIVAEATRDHGRMAALGAALLPWFDDQPTRVLTHCNTGPLACGQVGTALGVVQVAHAEGRSLHVYVDETRPWLQGARLTAWELGQAGIPCTLLADAAAGWLLASGQVDAVLVGADRIAANGDTANKIGTYPLAVLASRHAVPFYVVAPTASIDLESPDGTAIPIEMRSPGEVVAFQGRRIAPAGTEAINPVFDVTPAELVTAIVTEEGVLRAPYGPALAGAVAAARARRPAVPARPASAPAAAVADGRGPEGSP